MESRKEEEEERKKTSCRSFEIFFLETWKQEISIIWELLGAICPAMIDSIKQTISNVNIYMWNHMKFKSITK